MKRLPAPEKNGKEKVKDPRKSGILKTFIVSLLMVGLGFLMMLNPGFAKSNVAAILGWSMIGVGVLLIVVTALNWNIMGLLEMLIGGGLVAVGIFVVVKDEYVAKSFGRIIAVFVGFHGLLCLMDGGKLKKMDRNYMPHTIAGIVMLAVALTLVFVDMEVYWLVCALGVLVILCGLSNLVLRSKFYLSLPKGFVKNDKE